MLRRLSHLLPRAPPSILCDKGFILKNSGNEDLYTNSLILLVKNMLCSKLHDHFYYYLRAVSYDIQGGPILKAHRLLHRSTLLGLVTRVEEEAAQRAVGVSPLRTVGVGISFN